MKLKDVLSKFKNNRNSQTVWNPKKRKLKELKISEDDLLNMEIDKHFLGDLK